MSITARWIPGGWTEQEVTVQGRPFSLVLPASPDEVLFHLEEHPEAASLGADPYWAQLWPTSLRLADAILQCAWPRGATAIELGCGIGLAGLAALAQGMRVTLSDYNPLAVSLALENARRNAFDQAEGLVLDWRSPPTRKFDVILASDVIYDRQLHVPLVETIEALAHAQTVVWIADGGRSATEEFFAIASRRWRIEMFDRAGQPASGIHIGVYRRMVCCVPPRQDARCALPRADS